MDNLTFGRGKHFCLGAPLSKLEMRVTLETFLDLAPDASVVADQELHHKQDLRIDGLAALELDLGPVPSLASQPQTASV
jgi:cytochrome P450